MSEHPKKKLRHPMAAPAVVGQRTVNAYGWESYGQRTPARWPPVTVNNEDQEQEHRATGYVGPNEAPRETEWQEYPKWVGGIVVQNEQEEQAAQAELSRAVTPIAAPPVLADQVATAALSIADFSEEQRRELKLLGLKEAQMLS